MERVSEVFLSATVKDTDHDRARYRRLARECLEKGGVAVFLQNHWVLPFAEVVSACRQRVGQASGYFGLFGFRYGWQPEPAGRSITELEFDAALERWQELSHPPIFVFHPTRPSEAASALEDAADRVLAEEFSDAAERARSKAAQAAFVARIGGMGRIVQNFSDQIEFVQRASLAVPLYNGDLLRQAGQAEPRGGSIPNEELGGIGRGKQLEALQDLLVTPAGRAPAICVVVHGREGWGQQELLDHLAHWPRWSCSAGPRLGRNRADLAALVGWAAAELGHSGAEATLDDLAARVVAVGARDNPVLLLHQHGLASLANFQQDFWQPLLAGIVARMPAGGGHKRLVVVVRHDRPLAAARADDPWTDDCDAPDFARLVALPECAAITARQVRDWLFELRLDPAEIGALAQRATTDPEGAADGTPHLVYQRLRDALPNWAELAAGDER